MTRPYRFVVRDEAGDLGEITLVCANDADALVVGRQMAGGGALEVWDGARRLGDDAANGPAAAAPFNPFRAAAWRRPRPPAGR